MKLKTIITTLSLITLTACGGGSSSSNTAADVSSECVSTRSQGDAILYDNSCDFAVTALAINGQGNGTIIINTVEPGQNIFFSTNGPLSLLRVCRAPSVASASGCS